MSNLLKPLLIFIKTTDTFLLIPLFIASISILLMVFTFTALSSALPQFLPLFYSLAWGEAQLASKSQLYVLPATVLIIALFNFAIFTQLHPSQIILKRMLLINILVVDIIILISLFKIIAIFI